VRRSHSGSVLSRNPVTFALESLDAGSSPARQTNGRTEQIGRYHPEHF